MEARDSAPLADEPQPGAVPNDQPTGDAAGPGDEDAPGRRTAAGDAANEDAQRPPHEDPHDA